MTAGEPQGIGAPLGASLDSTLSGIGDCLFALALAVESLLHGAGDERLLDDLLAELIEQIGDDDQGRALVAKALRQHLSEHRASAAAIARPRRWASPLRVLAGGRDRAAPPVPLSPPAAE